VQVRETGAIGVQHTVYQTQLLVGGFKHHTGGAIAKKGAGGAVGIVGDGGHLFG